MFQYLAARLRERSTWLGVVAFLSASGVVIAPGVAETVATLGTAAAGLIFAAFPHSGTLR